MAYALVGTIGAVNSAAAGGDAAPLWGASENRTANNLLICFVTITNSTTIPSTPTGWSLAKSVAGTSCAAVIFYLIATGGDAAPTIFGDLGNSYTAAQLAEFSGNATSSPLDQTGSATGTTSPITATNGAADAATGELLIMTGADRRSLVQSPNDTWTSNNGTVTAAGNNNGSSAADHYSMGYILGTTANASADTSVMTLSNTTNLTGLAVAAASFKLAGGAAVVASYAWPCMTVRNNRRILL
jgi:hypothetical protein